MTAKRQREIVIEFEKVQLIRKRAKTTLEFCADCGREADFVELLAAALIFGTTDVDLKEFIDANAVHHDPAQGFDTSVCVPSLLAIMHARHNGGVRLIGETTD